MLFAQVVHVVGDAGVAVGLARTLYDVPVGEARTEVALYLALAFAPYALLAPLVAPLVARRARSHGAVVVVSDVGRALLAVLLIPRLGTGWLYPLGFAVLVLSRTHAVSRAALVPELCGRDDDLVEANAAISLASGAAGVAGGVTGLALSAVAGATGPLLLAAAVFGLGSVTGLWLPPPGPSPDEPPSRAWLTDRGTRRIAVAAALGRVAVGFTVMVLAFRFHGPDETAGLAVSLLALGAGTWLAPLAAPSVRRLTSRLPVLAAAGALAPAGLAGVLLDGSPWRRCSPPSSASLAGWCASPLTPTCRVGCRSRTVGPATPGTRRCSRAAGSSAQQGGACWSCR